MNMQNVKKKYVWKSFSSCKNKELGRCKNYAMGRAQNTFFSFFSLNHKLLDGYFFFFRISDIIYTKE